MTREQTFASAGWARAFSAIAPPFEDASIQIDIDTLVSVLEALPGYAEITITVIDGDARRVFDLMARDIPGPGRRFTNLTTGFEWFDIGVVLKTTDAQFVTATKRGEEQPMLFVSL